MPFRTPPVEVVFTSLMLTVMLGLSLALHLPIRLPGTESAASVGIRYLFPVLGVLLWSVCAALGGDGTRTRPIMAALPCYMIVLFVHFHIKLWVPLITHRDYDALFWSIDRSLHPVVEGAMGVRRALATLLPYDMHLYMTGFLLLFYISFCYHALRTPDIFRMLFLAALFMQGLGALAYLAFPAIGPFIYERGTNPFTTEAQELMLHIRQDSMAGGASWLSAHGGDVLMAGLGAMPSLHVGISSLFLWFAIRHGRVLLPTYIPLFLYIVVNSIASRWHYLIDLPAGLALSACSIWLAGVCVRGEQQVSSAPLADARAEADDFAVPIPAAA